MRFLLFCSSGILIVLALTSVPLSSAEEGAESSAAQSDQPIVLDVYKTPTCGCCQVWIDHLEERGFLARVHHPRDLDGIKRSKGIPVRLQSCHTGVSKEGYVFEGHIPAHLIRRFLDDPLPGAIGLTVPAMPVGSPGMESGERFMPYEVWLLGDDGPVGIYARVRTREEQYRP